MKIFRNRTVVGVLCILLSLVICFGITPLFTRSASEKATQRSMRATRSQRPWYRPWRWAHTTCPPVC